VALEYDPFDFSLDVDPWPVWGRLREEAPLYRNEARGFYALSRFADVWSVLGDWRTYSSSRGNLLEVIALPGDARPRFLSFLDPPEHQQLRRIVARGFSPAAVSALEPRIRELAAKGLDRLLGAGEFDFVGDFAAQLPVAVIAELMGLPEALHGRLLGWTDAHMARRQGQTDYEQGVLDEMRECIAELSAERRLNPREDMLSVMACASIPGPDCPRALEPQELLDLMVQLILAGSETSARLMGWSVRLLAQHPGQARRLWEDPDLIPGAIEEVLRYEPPLVRQARLVTRDVEWHGRTVREGSVLLLLFGAAMRDPREFEHPDEFRVDRRIERPLAFSAGIHHCLGASLARLEGRIVLEELTRRFRSWDVDEEGLEFAFSSFNRGYGRIPITPLQKAWT
jgi:cytochrome P450